MRRRSLLALAALPAAAAAAQHAPACSGSHPALCALAARVGADGSNTHALLVQRGGSTLAEAYFTGTDRPSGDCFARSVAFTADHPHDLRSTTSPNWPTWPRPSAG